MRERSLNGRWQFCEASGGAWKDATVPGGVYTDLLEAGEIEDPFHEDNELDVQWVGKSDWDYRRTFEVDAATLDHDRVRLVCDGLDTVASVLVNGQHVGESVNMHVGNEFDVADALEPGENEVRISFRSPVEYGIRAAERYPYDVPAIRYPVDQPGRPFVRKAQCHYGWDWGPCLPTMGIYRDVSLVAYSEPRIRYTTTEQDHSGDGVDLTVRAGVDAPTAGEYDVTVAVADAEATETVSLAAGDGEASITVRVDDPELWWPRGYGDQPLYDLSVTVGGGESSGDDVEDESSGDGGANGRRGQGGHTVTDRIGFREVDLVTEPDEAGTSFSFEVNGQPVYAKGANVVPVAPLYGEVTRDRYEHLVRSAADANMNTLRVWGGGYYLDDDFYDLCDERGLLVWQDFMFACSLYPANPEFLETVEEEVRHQVRRLANHPAIALWCGNNENEEALHSWFADHEAHEAHVDDYRALYERTVEPACREEDPSRPYWPGSPSSGRGEDDPYRSGTGDVHFWDVWHDGAPFSAYRETEPRFVSEFGYQSFPSTDSLRTVLEPDDFNPTAPMMEHHQRDPGGNATILRRMADAFRLPFDFEDFVYLSQVQHGLAMQTAIEHWRRRKPTTMGTLYWQLNVLWPVASWASLEYDGKWKAQQYMARRQYAPVLLSFEPGSDCDCADDDGRDRADRLELWLTSDLTEPIDATVECEVLPLDGGDAVASEAVDVAHVAGASEPCLAVSRDDLPDDVGADEVLVRATYDGPGESYAAHGFFEPFKALALPETDLDVDVDGADVTVRTEGAALFVALDPGTIPGAFSDDFFHLVPGEERTVTFESYDDRRDAAVEAHLEDELTVTHLRETY